MSVLRLCPSSSTAEFYTAGTITGAAADNAGFDLFVPENCVIPPGEMKFVSMDLKAVVSEGGQAAHYWLVPRSSISKTGLVLANSIGVIDRSYRGSLMGAFWNMTTHDVPLTRGQRLLQIVSRDMTSFSAVEIVGTAEELGVTARGEGGFGSSGR
jgi:dUTP pyrophosphatase